MCGEHRTPYNPRGEPVILDPLLQAIERHRLTIAGEEQAGALRVVGLGAMSLQAGTTFLGGLGIFTLLKGLEGTISSLTSHDQKARRERRKSMRARTAVIRISMVPRLLPSARAHHM